MTKKYDTLVFTGRFQPLHNAHVEIIRRACEITRELIIVIGSANQPRTFKNPFTVQERTMMINNVLNGIITGDTRVYITSTYDTIYDNQAWASRVQAAVAAGRTLNGNIGIIGHRKDDTTTEYLDMFPQWEFEEVPLFEPLNASNVRELYFKEGANLNFIRSVVPQPVFRMLEGWKGTPEYNNIVEENEIVRQIRLPYVGLKYPPIFVTTDACVFQSGHVLLIKRRAHPGKDLWAFPGGYLEAQTDKSIVDGMIRELRQETGLKVPEPVLKGSIQAVKVFDAVDRSPRGRIITHAHKIVLPNGPLSKVKGMDDAKKAKHWPISEVVPEMMFEDHWDIFQWAKGA